MEQSLFIRWVQKYFPGIVIRSVETLNGTDRAASYLHRRFLTKEYSSTGKWDSMNIINTMVMADVVAMDSSLPLKKRDALSKANGDIPKMGMEMHLNERQLTDLDTLIAQGGTEQQIVAKLFADTPKVIGGIWERNEDIFLQGLSTGIALVTDLENVGTGIRVNYAVPAVNKFGVTGLWSNPTTAKPVDDFNRVLAVINTRSAAISKVLMDKTAFNNLVATDQIKQYFAFSQGYSGGNLFPPDIDQMNKLANAKWQFQIEIVDRTMFVEKNGIQTPKKPWADGAVTFITTENLGNLFYAKLAEQSHPVAGVSYETVDDFILVSKYRTNRPSLAEFTTSQARVLPVLANVDQIFIMDTKTVQA